MSTLCRVLLVAFSAAASAAWINPDDYQAAAKCMESAPGCLCSDFFPTFNKSTYKGTCNANCNTVECGYMNDVCTCEKPTLNGNWPHVNVTAWVDDAATFPECRANDTTFTVGQGDCSFYCSANGTEKNQHPWVLSGTDNWIVSNLTSTAGAGGCQWNNGTNTNSFGMFLCAYTCDFSDLKAKHQPADENQTITWTCPSVGNTDADRVDLNGECTYTCDNADYVPIETVAAPNKCGCFDGTAACNSTQGEWNVPTRTRYCHAPCDSADLQTNFSFYDGNEWVTSTTSLLDSGNSGCTGNVKYGEFCNSTATFNPVAGNASYGTIFGYQAMCAENALTKKPEWIVNVDLSAECQAPEDKKFPANSSVTYETWKADGLEKFTIECLAGYSVMGGGVGNCDVAVCGNKAVTEHKKTEGDVHFTFNVTKPSVANAPSCMLSCNVSSLAAQLTNLATCTGAAKEGDDEYVNHGTRCAIECAGTGTNQNNGPYCDNGDWVSYAPGFGGAAGSQNIYADPSTIPTCNAAPVPVPIAPPVPAPVAVSDCTWKTLSTYLVTPTDGAAQPMMLASGNGMIDVTSCAANASNGDYEFFGVSGGEIPVTCDTDYVPGANGAQSFSCVNGMWDLTKIPTCEMPPVTCGNIGADFAGCSETAANGTICRSITCVDAEKFVNYSTVQNTAGEDVYALPTCQAGTWINVPTCVNLCPHCNSHEKCGGMCSADCASPACGLSCEQAQVSVQLKPSKLRAVLTYNSDEPLGQDTWVGLYKAGTTDLTQWIAAMPVNQANPQAAGTFAARAPGANSEVTVEFSVDDIPAELYSDNTDLVAAVVPDLDTGKAASSTSEGVCQTLSPCVCPKPDSCTDGVKSFWRVLAILFMIGFFIALAGLIVLLRKMTSDRASYKELA